MAEGVAVRTVSEVMSTSPVTAVPSETIADAAGRMADHRVGSVIVVDGDRPIGILTERDLVRFGASGANSEGTKVSEWMTEAPDCVAPDVSVQEAFDSLAEHGYRHIPVVEAGRLVGVVSLRDLMRLAQIQPVVHPSLIEAPAGLKGVIVAETSVGDVRGLEGFYHYRQYNAVELAEKKRLEDVWHLLFEGHLPSRAEREAFIAEIRPLRVIPGAVREVLPQIARASSSVMEGLRTAVSLVAAVEGFKPTLDIDAAERRRNALQVCAVVPTLIMAMHRYRSDLEPIDPRDDLGYGANYMWMLTGEEPDADKARAVEQYQITTIDHGFNASTFTGRVIVSTGADIGAAVVGAIGALSGPLHGGAPSRALDLLDAIATPDNARPYLVDAVTRGEKIMGFGHAVYRTEDPRSTMLHGVAQRLDAGKLAFAEQVERTVVEVLNELKPGRNLYANVEFYAGVVMEEAGLPRDLFTPTFASSRVIGWCANMLEQAADNRIIRPSARYVGPPPPEPVPDDQ
ncbi:MAG TPA: citrate synthase [Acidimicrobiales bacterium]|jgi:citrate synthase|nr:citrate synthase [Acidimicrobiales bacterium]